MTITMSGLIRCSMPGLLRRLNNKAVTLNNGSSTEKFCSCLTSKKFLLVADRTLLQQTVRTLFKEDKNRTLQPMHSQDGVDTEYDLVYENIRKNSSKWFPLFLAPSFPVIMGLAALGLYRDFVQLELTWGFEHYVVMTSLLVCSLFYFITHRLLRLTLLRIYYNSNTDHYIAVIRRNYLKQFNTGFTLGEIEPVPATIFGYYLRGHFKLKGVRYFVNSSDFSLPLYYNRLRGFDKPLQARSQRLSKLKKKR